MNQLTLNTYGEEDIHQMDKEMLKHVCDNLGAVMKAAQSMTTLLVERTLAPLVCKYNIKSIQLDPGYFYNDDGYSFINCMTYLNQEDTSGNFEPVPHDLTFSHKKSDKITYSLLQHEIDLALEPLLGALKESMNINVPELKIKYRHLLLDNELEETKKSSNTKKAKKI